MLMRIIGFFPSQKLLFLVYYVLLFFQMQKKDIILQCLFSSQQFSVSRNKDTGHQFYDLLRRDDALGSVSCTAVGRQCVSTGNKLLQSNCTHKLISVRLIVKHNWNNSWQMYVSKKHSLTFTFLMRLLINWMSYFSKIQKSEPWSSSVQIHLSLKHFVERRGGVFNKQGFLLKQLQYGAW